MVVLGEMLDVAWNMWYVVCDVECCAMVVWCGMVRHEKCSDVME